MRDEILDAIDEAAEAAEAIDPGTAVPEEKKKPGRPKKKIITVPAEVLGIAAAPVNADDLIEMVYCNPRMFKKLLALYKSYEVSEIEMTFDIADVKIKARDHLGKSTIYTTIDSKYLNYYYCREKLRICVKREHLERILRTLDKNHYKITFLLKENYRSTLYIIIKDFEYDNDDNYEVEVVYKPEEANATETRDDDKEYPIKFVLSSKHFKKKVSDIRKLSPVLTIQKIGDEPLLFTYDEAKKVNYNGVYTKPDKIRLTSKVAADDIFSVSVVIDYIKPFSNSNIGDEVFIAADKREKISFMTFLDKKDSGYVASLKVFTEVKDYRRVTI